jgi:hypothetical protein
METATWWLAILTGMLALFTGLLALATFLSIRESRETSRKHIAAWEQNSLDQIGVKTWMEFLKRFDSPEMLKARKRLCKQLIGPAPPASLHISDTLLNFFEDLGIAYKHGYVVEELAHSSFSIYVTHYWEATRQFTDAQRRRYGGDKTIGKDFEDLAKAMRGPGDKIDENKLHTFLADETTITND